MIRRLQRTDISRVAEIWLDTNLKAHYFISAQYWKRNFNLVKEMLSQSEVYVHENSQEIRNVIKEKNNTECLYDIKYYSSATAGVR